jgi:hypothetical protein
LASAAPPARDSGCPPNRVNPKLLKKQGFPPKLQERLDAPPSPGTQ